MRSEDGMTRPVRLVAVDVELSEHMVFARAVLVDAAGRSFTGRLGSSFLFDFKAGDALDEGFTRVPVQGPA